MKLSFIITLLMYVSLAHTTNQHLRSTSNATKDIIEKKVFGITVFRLNKQMEDNSKNDDCPIKAFLTDDKLKEMRDNFPLKSKACEDLWNSNGGLGGSIIMDKIKKLDEKPDDTHCDKKDFDDLTQSGKNKDTINLFQKIFPNTYKYCQNKSKGEKGSSKNSKANKKQDTGESDYTSSTNSANANIGDQGVSNTGDSGSNDPYDNSNNTINNNTNTAKSSTKPAVTSNNSVTKGVLKPKPEPLKPVGISKPAVVTPPVTYAPINNSSYQVPTLPFSQISLNNQSQQSTYNTGTMNTNQGQYYSTQSQAFPQSSGYINAILSSSISNSAGSSALPPRKNVR